MKGIGSTTPVDRRSLFLRILVISAIALFTAAALFYDGKRIEVITNATDDVPSFTLKGSTTLNADIDGETHRFVCYSVNVSEFWCKMEKEKADLIGEDEEFTKFMQPDGTWAYYATYYEALDEERGLRIRKEFMDCGTDAQFIDAGVFSLVIEFDPGASDDSGILDERDKAVISTVVFE